MTNKTLITSCLVGGHFNTGNLSITPFHLNESRSMVIDSHKHEAGHNVICLMGEFEVLTEDPTCGCRRMKTLTQGQHVWIPAGVLHSARAVTEDAQGVCVFVKGTFDFEVAEENNGWEENKPFNIELPESEQYKP